MTSKRLRSRRSVILMASALAVVAGMLIWAKLRLLQEVPQTAVARPARQATQAPDTQSHPDESAAPADRESPAR
jgi:hypothetical protein